MSKIIDMWRHLLDDDPKETHPGQWLGVYRDGADDPAFMLQCLEDFIHYGRQQYHLSISLMVKCFMLGTHSLWLSEWRHPTGGFHWFFSSRENLSTPKKEGKMEVITFFYKKNWPHLAET